MKKGFVLLETIVVTGVLGIIMMMMYPAFLNLVNLVNTTSNYDNTDYLYRTNSYKKYVTEELGSNNLKIICQGNCTNERQKFFGIQAIYLVNPNQIESILNRTDIYITTKRYLKTIMENEEYSEPILVIAYKGESDDLYEYAVTSLGSNNSPTNPSNPSNPSNNVTLISHIRSIVAGASSSNQSVITKPSSDSSCTNTFAYDGTTDNNLRYVGANPCNYVWFNNELWRIIGIMENIESEDGSKNAKIKLIKKDKLGNYAWDTDRYLDFPGSPVVYKFGLNDWTSSILMKELNEDYLDITLTEKKQWVKYSNELSYNEYNYTKGLKSDGQALIDKVKWNLGGVSSENYYNALEKYKYERGTNVYDISEELEPVTTGGVTIIPNYSPPARHTEWFGKVGLIYYSDYYFASGNSDENRSNCLLHSIKCYQENWISSERYAESIMWTITPNTWLPGQAYDVTKGNHITGEPSGIYPVVYLYSDILYVSGNGSATSPYKIK